MAEFGFIQSPPAASVFRLLFYAGPVVTVAALYFSGILFVRRQFCFGGSERLLLFKAKVAVAVH